MKRLSIIFVFLLACACSNVSLKEQPKVEPIKATAGIKPQEDKAVLINPLGSTVQTRIKVPEGFEREKLPRNSFGEYLRSLPVKPDGAEVRLYNGENTYKNVHSAVLDIDVGDRDLQQCADAVMRLRAEYLYGQGRFDEIHFNFTNGFKADYPNWMKGNRISVDGNNAYWVKKAAYSKDYSSFRKYMDMVFAYAGTLSLSKELKEVPVGEIKAGDVFIKGDDPGHAVIVLDTVKKQSTGEKMFIIAQSYMPAQDIHILKNPENNSISPWYPADFGDILFTPQWEFKKEQLMGFE